MLLQVAAESSIHPEGKTEIPWNKVRRVKFALHSIPNPATAEANLKLSEARA